MASSSSFSSPHSSPSFHPHPGSLSGDELWKKRVEELIEYRGTNGHCWVPVQYDPNKALGLWVNTVRTQDSWRRQGKKTSLTDARVSELDDLDFFLKAKSREGPDKLWTKRVQELVAYRDTNGHCRVPFLYEPNRALGWWVNKARTQYTWRRQGKKITLTDAHLSELDDLGFAWKAGTKSKEGLVGDELWKKRVQELVAYRDTNGHCRVPGKYEPNKALGGWVNRARSQYTWHRQGKKTPLTDARISELDNLGFVWVAGTKSKEGLTDDELWKKRMQELVAFRDLKGHCRVPGRYEPNRALGWWVSRVRNQYLWSGQGKKTPLTDARMSELDNLGFVWEVGTKKKEGLVGDELWKKGEQNISGLSASQEKPLNSIDQDAAPPNRTISPPSVPPQGAPRNVLPQSSTAMLQTNNQITFNPSPANNAGSKDSKKFSCVDGMEEMFKAMRAEEKRREYEELKARQSNSQHCTKPSTVWIL
jgi:hypothetical protein